MQRSYLERMESQLRLRFALGCLSPLGWFEEAGQRLCRTSAHDCLTYMEEVRDYRFRVLDFSGIINCSAHCAISQPSRKAN